MSLEAWTGLRHEAADEAVRLICFAHAGAGAQAFASWVKFSPPGVGIWPLQYPGRYSRLRERPHTSMEELVAEVVPITQQLGTMPYAFFGHCLGALVALEVAYAQQCIGAKLPNRIFVSSMAAPAGGERRVRSHQLTDRAFLKRVEELGGLAPEIAEEPELVELILPALRADFQIYETYRFDDKPPLDVPITVVAAENDPFISREQFQRWSSRTVREPQFIWTHQGRFGVLESKAVFDRVIASLTSGA
jgi:surfactin synthase thioesterase subunit